MPNSKLEVIFEDNHLLVIDKPPLLPTMGAAAGEDSLVVQAKEYLKHKYRKPGNVYVGVVSRLDSYTSGVIVLAKTSKAASRLSLQFKNGSVEKNYLAIVPLEVPEEGSWSDHLVKNETAHRMMTVAPNHELFEKAKLASLEFSTLEINQKNRLVLIKLLTGRKHQIRVQFASRRFPILGDRKYGSKNRFETGIALRACTLTIEHPTLKKAMKFITNPPINWPFGPVIRHYLKNQS